MFAVGQRPLCLALWAACAVTLGAQEPKPATDQPREALLLRQVSAGRVADRRVAILAARELETPDVVAEITAIARSDEHVSLRRAAIETFGFYRDEGGTDMLLGLLDELRRGHADARLVAATYEALGRRGGPAVFDVLVAGLEDGQVETGGAAAGLELLADSRAYDHLLRALRPFELALIHGRPIFRAMFACDRARAIELFCQAMRDESTPQPYRFRFEEVMREHPGADVAEAARALLDADYPDAVGRGLRILGACERVQDVPVITTVLHAEPQQRLACVQALGAMAHDLTVDDLVRYLGDESAKVRAEVAHALGAIGADRITPDLVERLAVEEDLWTRIRIVEALGRIGDRRAVASLFPLLADRSYVKDPPHYSMRSPFPGNTEMRYAALWSLQRIRDGESKFDLRLKNPGQWEAAAPEKELAAWRAWWQANETDESFRVRRR